MSLTKVDDVIINNLPTEIIIHILSFIPIIDLKNMRYELITSNIDEINRMRINNIFNSAELNALPYTYNTIEELVKDLNKSCKYGLVNNMAIVFNKIELFPNESYKKEFILMCEFMNIIHHIISMEYLDALIYLCNEFELINCDFSKKNKIFPNPK